jgi:hypothetical protein
LASGRLGLKFARHTLKGLLRWVWNHVESLWHHCGIIVELLWNFTRCYIVYFPWPRLTRKGHHDDDGMVATTDNHLSRSCLRHRQAFLSLLRQLCLEKLLLFGSCWRLEQEQEAFAPVRGTMSDEPSRGTDEPSRGTNEPLAPVRGTNMPLTPVKRTERLFGTSSNKSKRHVGASNKRERWSSVLATVPSSSWCPLPVILINVIDYRCKSRSLTAEKDTVRKVVLVNLRCHNSAKAMPQGCHNNSTTIPQ